jgi:hypothetical protein
MILLHVADEDPDELPFFSEAPEGPAERLFVIQRVNRTFQATIRDSILLQQRMYLAPYPFELHFSNLSNPESDRFDPIRWFRTGRLARFDGLHCDDIRTCGDWIECFPVIVQDGRSPDEVWMRPEASWRRMSCHPCQMINLGAILERCDLEWQSKASADITLGQLSDLFEQLAHLARTFIRDRQFVELRFAGEPRVYSPRNNLVVHKFLCEVSKVQTQDLCMSVRRDY